MYERVLRDGAHLAPLQVWHAEEFANHMNRALEHIRPWVGASFVTTDVQGARKVLEGYAVKTSQGTGGIHGIWLDGTLVGGVMAFDLSVAMGSCEVGCWLEPAAEGYGLVTPACEALLEWAFRERGLHRVEWHCRADNDRSSAVARRLGMTLEGIRREAWPYEGRRYDKQVWAVLAHEWMGTSARKG
jgi:RimJ/RimL family protein N-acetyltransferase